MFKKIVFESGSQKSPKVGKSGSPKVRKGAGVITPKVRKVEKVVVWSQSFPTSGLF
jgi:hypothetical protein